MSLAPDFAEPVAGFRAWLVDEEGQLRPVSMGSSWEPGVNKAVCHGIWPGRAKHSPPHTDCQCGLHAFHNPANRDLAGGGYALGAIAAWGEIDVYRAGFRAEYGCVVALAYREESTIRHFRRLQAAAERYGVNLVEYDDLLGEALRYARPLPRDALPRQASTARAKRRPRRTSSAPGAKRSQRPPAATARPAIAPSAPPWAAGNPGFCLRSHLMVQVRNQTATVSATPAYLAAIGSPLSLSLCAAGAPVTRGDVIAVLETEAGRFAVSAPVDGRLSAVNEPLASKPERMAPDDWVARIEAGPPEFSAGLVVWGEEGWREYLRHVAARDDDIIRAEAALSGQAPLEASSAAELLEALRGRRRSAQPPACFLAEEGRLMWLARTLDRELAADASLCEALQARGIGLEVEILGCDQHLVVDVSPAARPCIRLGREPTRSDVVLRLDPSQLHGYWSGELDLAGSIGEGLVANGSRRDVLRVNALLRRLFPRYAEHARPLLEGRRQAWHRLTGAGRWWQANAAAA